MLVENAREQEVRQQQLDSSGRVGYGVMGGKRKGKYVWRARTQRPRRELKGGEGGEGKSKKMPCQTCRKRVSEGPAVCKGAGAAGMNGIREASGLMCATTRATCVHGAREGGTCAIHAPSKRLN